MTFFNKKEDVLKIELTPHGRQLLMKGELKPEYYAFFDDDILYDTQYTGASNNTDAKTRIITDTPSLKPPTTLTSIESKYWNAHTKEEDNILLYPIGTNRATSKGANGWEATAIMGEFSSSLAYMSSSDAPLPKIKGTLSALHNIPQVECEMNFTMSVGLYGKDKYLSQDYDSSEIAEDNTFIKLTTKPLILHLLEKNGFSYKDSLSIEVFKYEPGSNTFFNKMYFSAPPPDQELSVFDEIDIDERIGDTSVFVGPDSVENYFFVSRDGEINRRDLCRGIKKLKEKSIYLGLEINCEDVLYDEVNIYETLVTEASIEDCE